MHGEELVVASQLPVHHVYLLLLCILRGSIQDWRAFACARGPQLSGHTRTHSWEKIHAS